MKSKLVRVTLCLVLIGVIFIGLQYGVNSPVYVGANQIAKFSSYGELKEFIETNSKYTGFLWKSFGRDSVFAPEAGQGAFAPTPSAPDHSTTNIQVAGVDEADIVKTDGQYIYVVSGNKTFILKAYPPDQAQILSEIEVEGIIVGIFVNKDRLVVFEEEASYYRLPILPILGEPSIGYMPPKYISHKVSIKVYDISNRENPSLQREISADGCYIGSRMIGDYAYVIVNEPVSEEDNKPNLPKISIGDEEKEIFATDIYYCNVYDYYHEYTKIIAINTQDDEEEPTYETILMGAGSTLYVSLNNIYLTFPVWGRKLGDSQKTTIHRIHIDSSAIEYVASGEVPGAVLNQFSMDEYNGYFRVATTTWDEVSENNIYILDMNLTIVGSLENLAPGETIYSARFMGERGYLVTFQKVDPLFVIDLSDPYNPRELGQLKIPGYSDYLQPYDENHLIGIGKEAVVAEEGDFAWYQGLKIALFDVSNVTSPREIANYGIGDRGTDSPVLRDHKAFLFNKSRNLMVIPVLVAEVDKPKYPEPWAYGKPVWQGAYVFHISPDNGITVRGRITHIEKLTDLEKDYYYFYSPFAVTRSLYIGDVLYTISEAKIKMNSLENLEYINEVKLPLTWTPPVYEPGE